MTGLWNNSTPCASGSDLNACSNRPVCRDGRRAVVSNPASIDDGFGHIVDRIAAAPGVQLAALFGPQHGFRSGRAGKHDRDRPRPRRRRRVPVYSLYSETREPTAEMLRDLDVLVIDLQDVGTRIYTYIYTMANCLMRRAEARRQGHRLRSAESDWRRSRSKGRCSSAASSRSSACIRIPMRHGMTIGELARLFNEHFGIGADLEVSRDGGLAAARCTTTTTGLPWVMPSPNIPTLDTAIVYPGTVLFEGTNVSEGRGTTRPFELLGAPWVAAERVRRGA